MVKYSLVELRMLILYYTIEKICSDGEFILSITFLVFIYIKDY